MGVELLFNSVEFGVPKQLPADFQTVETRCGREGHTRPGGPRKALTEWTPTSGEKDTT